MGIRLVGALSAPPSVCDNDQDTYVILQFSCLQDLPNGARVLPVLSLPVLLRSDNSHATGEVSDQSAPNDTETSDMQRLRQFCSAQNAQCMRVFASKNSIGKQYCLETCTNDISSQRAFPPCSVIECAGALGIGGKVWDATYGLVQYLRHHPQLVQGKVVVELGSGTGLSGR
jgi:hypothetical protein